MIYALIIAFTILIGVILLAVTRERGLASVTAAGVTMRELADSLRNPDVVGVSPKINRTRRTLRRAYKCVLKKVEAGEEIYEFERILYENYNHVFDCVKRRDYKYFQALPHKFNKTRIEIIAEHIVRSGGVIDAESVKAAIDDFNSYTTLHIDEITSFEQALKLAYLRYAANAAMYSPEFRRMKKRALKDTEASASLARNACYIYWRSRSGKGIDAKTLAETDVNLDNIEYDFSTRLIEYGKRMQAAVKSLKSLKNIFTRRFTLELSDTHRILSQNSVYAVTDEVSQLEYLRIIEKYSFDFSVSERAVVNACFELERKSGENFTEFLFKKRVLKAELNGREYGTVQPYSARTAEILLISLVYGANAVVSAALGAFTLSAALGVPIAILSFFALLKTTEFIVMKAHRQIMRKRPSPRLNAKSVPTESAVLVTVPHYIADKSDLMSAIEHIKTLRAGNFGENVNFALLIDYKGSSEPVMPYELEWNAILDKELADFGDVNYFVRRKTKTGGVYGGRERKRGAIEDMNEMLLTGDRTNFAHVMREPDRYEYAIVLDADSKLLPGAVLQAVNTISHPLNAKYDLMAFDNAYDAFTMKSLYSKQYYYSAGHECYGANSDYYYDFVGKAVFSGKGIYRIASFRDKLDGVLPDNRVLSHDLIEGAIVETGALNISVFEDVPNTAMSDTDRRNRWLRGDTQLLEFVGGRFKNKRGAKVKLDTEPIYGYIMANNFMKAVGEIALFALLTIALFIPKFFVFLSFAAAFLAIPIIETGVYALGGSKGVRFRYTVRAIIAKITQTVFAFFMLPFHAVNNFIVILKSGFSLLTGAGLKWRTFSMSQKSRGFASYIALIVPSLIVLIALGFAGMGNLAVTGFTALSFAVITALYPASVEFKRSKIISENDRNELLGAAAKTYGFFRSMRGGNGIIADNYQAKPYVGMAQNTSPTNIGLSMVAEISAFELGIIDVKTAHERLIETLESASRMEKYGGHLYNWYNPETLEVIEPKYISSVDSGNFIASLIVVKEFLKKYELSGAEIAERLIDGADLEFLFDDERGLFRIGYNVTNDKFDGHYDMLASEARILYFVAAGLTRNIQAWNNLSRDVAGNRGNTLLSWSGTMFEYLMPSIFMKGSEYGLLERSSAGAVSAQIANKCRGLWGISECGYYKFDAAMRYQYRAFGLSELAKRTEVNRCVIAPYAVFLAIEYAPKSAIQNLELIRERGGYGEMGYYEAIDYTSGDNVVRSYMAHHQGMIMASIANYLLDGAIRKLFMSDERMHAAALLLTEKHVKSKAVKREKGDFVYDKKLENKDYESEMTALSRVAAMGNGRYSVVIRGDGVGYSSYRGNLINKFRSVSGAYGVMPVFRCGGKEYSPLSCLTQGKHTAVSSINECTFVGENCRMDIFVPHCVDGELRELTWLNASNGFEKVACDVYVDLAMSRLDDDLSHPAFSDMFISTEVLDGFNSVIAERKPREGGAKPLFTAFTVIGAENVNIETNKYNYIGRNGSIISRNPSRKYPKTGDVLYPCFGAEVKFDAPPSALTRFYVLILCGDNRESLIERVKLTKDENYADFLKDSARVVGLSPIKRFELSPSEFAEAQKLAAAVLYGEYAREVSLYSAMQCYAELGLPLNKTLIVEYTENVDFVIKIQRIVKYLNFCAVGVNLIVVGKNGDSYFDKGGERIRELCDDRIKFVFAPLNRAIYESAFMILDGSDISEIQPKEVQKSLKIADETKSIAKNSQNIAISGALDTKSGCGGYKGRDYFVIDKPLLPYSWVLAGKYGGTVITENGGGFTYYKNSRELKLTEWNNNPIEDTPSERLYMITRGNAVRVNRLTNGYVKYSDSVKFVNTVGNIAVEVEESLICDGAVKCIRVTAVNRGEKLKDVEFILDCDFAADWKASPSYIHYGIDENVSTALNMLSGFEVFYSALGGYYTCGAVISECGRRLDITEGYRCIRVFASLRPNEEYTEEFIISMDRDAADSVKKSNIDGLRKEEQERGNKCNAVALESGDKALDKLFNRLGYQVTASRMDARAGYYQAGGAAGFRDALQDSLALLHFDRERVKDTILSAARRQFIDGDVLHWWHEPNKGVRTRISDDKLFLPYVVCEYIKVTGDSEILDTEIPYLKGAVLAGGVESAYADYEASEISETLYMHCKRAIDSALNFGEHGLLKIGAGDWNDALNAIGIEGRGESVWLTMFAYKVIGEFIELMPSGTRLKYLDVSEALKKSIATANNGAWFKRAFTDDGVWLGDSGSEVCKIDLLCQAFAVLSGAVERRKAETAIDSAIKYLVDKENGIIKLLTPPFNTKKYYGYISAYPEGVRENGGQYTHAAIWFIMALCRLKRYDEAFELFEMINPVKKCMDADTNAKYMGEPYVLAGDVYSSGQMGWSWYTGSAAWAYKLIIEEFIGIKPRGEWLEIDAPRINRLNGFRVRYEYGNSVYNLRFVRGERRSVTVNGVRYAGGKIPLSGDGKEYNCEIVY